MTKIEKIEINEEKVEVKYCNKCDEFKLLSEFNLKQKHRLCRKYLNKECNNIKN